MVTAAADRQGRFSFWTTHLFMVLLPGSWGIVEISSSNTPPIHCGQEVAFVCTANTTNFIDVTVNDYGTKTFERNSDATEQLGPVDLSLIRADVDPKNPFLTIFEVKGTLEDAKTSLNITCRDVSGFKSSFLLLKSDCPEMVNATEIDLSDCNGPTYSEGSQAVEVEWNLSRCPGWEEVQLYTVCTSRNCTSASGNDIISPHHICGIYPGEYNVSITALNVCQEMFSDTTNITLEGIDNGKSVSTMPWPTSALGVLAVFSMTVTAL